VPESQGTSSASHRRIKAKRQRLSKSPPYQPLQSSRNEFPKSHSYEPPTAPRLKHTTPNVVAESGRSVLPILDRDRTAREGAPPPSPRPSPLPLPPAHEQLEGQINADAELYAQYQDQIDADAELAARLQAEEQQNAEPEQSGGPQRFLRDPEKEVKNINPFMPKSLSLGDRARLKGKLKSTDFQDEPAEPASKSHDARQY
jgi:hypothetical protein